MEKLTDQKFRYIVQINSKKLCCLELIFCSFKSQFVFGKLINELRMQQNTNVAQIKFNYDLEDNLFNKFVTTTNNLRRQNILTHKSTKIPIKGIDIS